METRLSFLRDVNKLNAKHILKSVYGYDSFRGEQREIIEFICNRGKALVIMPTGGGKSICYQIPSIVNRGVGIIISPLISLMEDQVKSLRKRGVRAEMLNSFQGKKESRTILDNILSQNIDILYMSPEKFVSEELQGVLSQIEISLIAVDEAHCLSQWGHDFRPEYLQMAHLIKNCFSDLPCLALTATADEITRKEIVLELGIEKGRVFFESFKRNNLIISKAHKKKNYKQKILDFIQDSLGKSCGIIYCSSRKNVEHLNSFLKSHNFNSVAYHAGLSKKERKQNQDRFISEDSIIVVATTAFGMGIDRPDVRFVVHADMPKSIESYYQEIGRAGRDGELSQTLLLCNRRDVGLWKYIISKNNKNKSRRSYELRKVDHMYALFESCSCINQNILNYFGEKSSNCGKCSECVLNWPYRDSMKLILNLYKKLLKRGHLFSKRQVLRILKEVNLEFKLVKNENKYIKFLYNQLIIQGILSEDEFAMVKFGVNARDSIIGDYKLKILRSLN